MKPQLLIIRIIFFSSNANCIAFVIYIFPVIGIKLKLSFNDALSKWYCLNIRIKRACLNDWLMLYKFIMLSKIGCIFSSSWSVFLNYIKTKEFLWRTLEFLEFILSRRTLLLDRIRQAPWAINVSFLAPKPKRTSIQMNDVFRETSNEVLLASATNRIHT